MLTVYGPDSFKQIIISQKVDVWESLSHSYTNNVEEPNKIQKKSKPMVDEHMSDLMKEDINRYCRGTLRRLVLWATQKSIGRGRSFWGVESLKPVWWPDTVKFECISKSNVRKDLIVMILHSYMVHNNIPIVIASSTPKKIIEEVNNSADTSTPKRVRPNASHSLTFTPIRKKLRVTEIDRDDIISVSDISADNSFFEGLTGEVILSKGNQVPSRPIDVKNTSKLEEKLLTKAKSNSKHYIRCSTSNILRKSVKEICVRELTQAGKWLSDVTIHAYCTLLKRRFPNISGLQDSIFSQNLGFKKAARDIPSIQLHSCGQHWVCSKYDGKSGAYLYDSLYLRKTSGDLDTQLALLYADHSQQLIVTVPSIQQQKGSSDCGLYALAVATAIAAGVEPETQSWNQDQMRSHCLKCINEEKITLFPINTTRGIRTGKLPESHQIIIDLICTCNLPIYAYVDQRESSVRYTVQCDVCDSWFHNECVGLPERSTIDKIVLAV